MGNEKDLSCFPIKDRFKYLLETEIYADCCFVFPEFDNQKLKAHKLVLATASDVFRAMLYGELSDNLPVYLKEDTPSNFKRLLDSIYTGYCELPNAFDELFKLYDAGERYNLPEVKTTCLRNIQPRLNVETVLKIYEFAKLYEIQPLIHDAENIICSQADQILRSRTFRDVKLETLLDILDDNIELLTSEWDLFNAVLSWGRNVKQENNHKLLIRIKNLLNSQELTDCSFVISEDSNDTLHPYTAHTLILSMASPVFREMLAGRTANDRPIKLKDMKPEYFKLLLDFVYTDYVKLPKPEELSDFSEIVFKYSLPLLLEECLDAFISNITEWNALSIYEKAQKFNLSQNHRIFQTCMEFIATKSSAVLNSPDFENIQLTTLLTILRNWQGYLDLSKVELFKATIRWAHKECKRMNLSENNENLRTTIEPVLKEIHFLTFTGGGIC